nr:MAG TPA: hypothetical protein [Caudoviricetes sp.]
MVTSSGHVFLSLAVRKGNTTAAIVAISNVAKE